MAHQVTLIPGDGIGPEVVEATKQVLAKVGVAIEWETVNAGAAVAEQCGNPIPDSVIQSLRRTRVGLKGPIGTPIGKGFRSVNVTLRKELDLYASVRPVRSIPGVPSRYQGIDLIIVRENTEDLYAGVERDVADGVAESIKIITRAASDRIIDYALRLARDQKRKRVTVVHKANIMKKTDGLFLQTAEQVATRYTDIAFDSLIVDACAMKLVMNPERFDVLVTENLYGDILSDLCAGLVGGLGVVPGANIGKECALFEAVHGTAPDIAGQGAANPTAVLLSAVMMLRHLNEGRAADRIEQAVYAVYGEGKVRTRDLGGTAGTRDLTNAICSKL